MEHFQFKVDCLSVMVVSRRNHTHINCISHPLGSIYNSQVRYLQQNDLTSKYQWLRDLSLVDPHQIRRLNEVLLHLPGEEDAAE